MLSAEYRREVCFHEAAHAVMYAVGGATVYRLAVAPVGATDWHIERRKGGGLMRDLWGVCQASDIGPHVKMHMQWDEADEKYLTNRKALMNLLKMVDAQMPNYKADITRQIRANMCAILAGPIASQIYDDNEVDIYSEDCRHVDGGDVAVAEALSNFLTRQPTVELNHAAALTEQLLRQPEIWALVTGLATELETVGDIKEDGIFDLLPEPRKDWPPAPAPKKGR